MTEGMRKMIKDMKTAMFEVLESEAFYKKVRDIIRETFVDHDATVLDPVFTEIFNRIDRHDAKLDAFNQRLQRKQNTEYFKTLQKKWKKYRSEHEMEQEKNMSV